MDEQRAWIKMRRKKRLRALAVALCICVLFTTYPNILETISAFAAGPRGEDKSMSISGFSRLPEDVREQTVPMGTGLSELELPDTLEAYVTVETGDEKKPDDETSDDGEQNKGDDETPDDGEQNKGDGKTPDDGEQNKGDGETPDDGEQNKGDEGTPEDGEQNKPDEAPPASGDGGSSEDAGSENAGTENTDEDATDGTGKEETSDETEDGEAAALSVQSGEFVMPEYQAEHVITVNQLEDSSAENTEIEVAENSRAEDTDVITITGITWQSDPAYDKDTEGIYIFTPILPGGGTSFRTAWACLKLP